MALADKQGFHKIISGKGQKMAIILPMLYIAVPTPLIVLWVGCFYYSMG